MIMAVGFTSEVNISNPATFADDFSQMVNVALKQHRCFHCLDPGTVVGVT